MLPGLIVNDPDPTMCNRHDNKVPLSFQIKIAGGGGGLHGDFIFTRRVYVQ